MRLLMCRPTENAPEKMRHRNYDPYHWHDDECETDRVIARDWQDSQNSRAEIYWCGERYQHPCRLHQELWHRYVLVAYEHCCKNPIGLKPKNSCACITLSINPPTPAP